MNNHSQSKDPLDDFACLDRFNTLFSHNVETRGASPLGIEDKELITALANGRTAEGRRESVIALLASNTTAMEYFTELLNESETKKSSKDNQ